MADTDTDSEQEFALIELLLPPGHDPSLVRTELAGFFADMMPRDTLGRRLVREIVVQSAWSDFLNGAFGPTLDHLMGGKAITPGVIGEAFATHFELLDGLIASSEAVRCGRDRLARSYDSRESTRLREALGLIEARLKELEPPAAAPDGLETEEDKDG